MPKHKGFVSPKARLNSGHKFHLLDSCDSLRTGSKPMKWAMAQAYRFPMCSKCFKLYQEQEVDREVREQFPSSEEDEQ
jgi:hypothetical protein